MRVIQQATDLPSRLKRAALAIGFFDGVHLGHQQIIRQTVADARQHEAASLVVSFDKHPSTIVAPDHVPPLIYSPGQRLRAIESTGADYLLLIAFDRELSQLTGEQFIRKLAADFGQIVSVCVGASFTFGHKRSGNVESLRKLGSELHFNVHGLAALALDGETVSSTRIREAIQGGQLDAAGQMLGRAYSLAGTVVTGARVGRKLNFPTANLDTTGLALPPNGVYAAHAQVGGRRHRAAVNIGVRPTVAGATPSVMVEAHLLDFSEDVYGQEMELTFVEKIREERRFPSLDALRAQIATDVEQTRRLFD